MKNFRRNGSTESISLPVRVKKDKITGAPLNERKVSEAKYTEQALGGPKITRFNSHDSTFFHGVSRRISDRARLEGWEFPGWGSHFHMEVPQNALEEIKQANVKEKKKIGEWGATAICGNDILSSVIYTSGSVTSIAGWLTPVCLFLVSGILYLFRFVYGEAITPLPLNGGSYSVLINTTTKSIASVSACFGMICYLATAVVSASSAVAYINTVIPELDSYIGTLFLLFFFACLTGYGIVESAEVALGMFILHVLTLTVVVSISSLYAICKPDTFQENMMLDLPSVTINGTIVSGSYLTALIMGTSGAILGVTGFESSCQFVEEQEPGVFLKTLKNMWYGVTVFNPIVCWLSFCVLSFEEIVGNSNAVLALMAKRIGCWLDELIATGNISALSSINFERFLVIWISLDAYTVLCGAVLAAYVGITGLISRMAKDRCLPQFLLRKNKWRNTNHYIIFGFFVAAASQYCYLEGNISMLSGVYTFSFLGIMIIFTLGCGILKVKRPNLPREVRVSYGTIIVCFISVCISFIVNMVSDKMLNEFSSTKANKVHVTQKVSKPETLTFFALYIAAVGSVVACVFQRIRILKLDRLRDEISILKSQPYVFFCKADDLYTINKAILYVRDNEQTDRLLVVHVNKNPDSPSIKSLSQHIMMLDAMYPKIKVEHALTPIVQISLLTVIGEFNPAFIEWLSQTLGIDKNMMFITCPDFVFKYKIEHLGGVRVITH